MYGPDDNSSIDALTAYVCSILIDITPVARPDANTNQHLLFYVLPQEFDLVAGPVSSPILVTFAVLRIQLHLPLLSP